MLSEAQRGAIAKLVFLIAIIQAYNSCRERSFLTRSGILHPRLSPWQRLLDFGDADSFLLMTGMTRPAFFQLQSIVFEPRGNRGRPPDISESTQLGLYLMYIGSKMSVKHLCLIFGVVPSTCSRVITRMLYVVVASLSENILASVNWPTAAKMAEFSELIAGREPLAKGVIGFMDGLALPTECSSNEEIQNAYYNGYHADTMINNVLAFGPDGKIFFAALNYPGSWHDGSLVMELLAWLKEKIGAFKVCVDQGFPRSGDAFDIFVGPFSEKAARNLSPILRDSLLNMANIYTSLRQSSEWGMRALQGTFPRLKTRMTSNQTKRKLILKSIVLIHNFRTEIVGLNQICTVFNPEYEKIINIDNYDRISRYYFPL